MSIAVAVTVGVSVTVTVTVNVAATVTVAVTVSMSGTSLYESFQPLQLLPLSVHNLGRPQELRQARPVRACHVTSY